MKKLSATKLSMIRILKFTLYSFSIVSIILVDTFFSPPDNGSGSEWAQQAHDAQRTGYSPIEPELPWTFKWHWEPDDIYSIPRSAHVVTGGKNIYMPGGSQGLYAINKSNGKQSWRKSGTFFAAAAYDIKSGYLFIGSANGILYKLTTDSGKQLGSYYAGSAINHSVLIVANYAYITTHNGELHKVNTNNMTRVWKYQGGSQSTTPATYSASRDIIIFGTQDLYIHAVKNSNGSINWRIKPTIHKGLGKCDLYSFQYGWPVVADQAGVVLVRMRLGDQNEWLYASDDRGKFPKTNKEIKNYLENHPESQTLFAINLDNGDKAFTPAIGNGGIDDILCGSLVSTIGPIPVIRTLSNGHQVVYTIFRNGQTADTGFPWDSRWDSHMGEMVLDDQTVNGYTAGDVRFIDHLSVIGNGIITDESGQITAAGDTIFHAHWGASESHRIVDRSESRGFTREQPIITVRNPPVIRRIDANYAGNQNILTHWTERSLILYCDGKSWGNSGFWVYWNKIDPPGGEGVCSTYSDGMRPRYTFVSGDVIYVVGNGGDIFALQHSGIIPHQPSDTPSYRKYQYLLEPFRYPEFFLIFLSFF